MVVVATRICHARTHLRRGALYNMAMMHKVQLHNVWMAYREGDGAPYLGKGRHDGVTLLQHHLFDGLQLGHAPFQSVVTTPTRHDSRWHARQYVHVAG